MSNKKNEKLYYLIQERKKLLDRFEFYEKRLHAVTKEIEKWSYAERGPLLYQYFHAIVRKIHEGNHPLSVEDIENNCVFEPVDRDRIREHARKSSHYYLFDIGDRFRNTPLSTPVINQSVNTPDKNSEVPPTVDQDTLPLQQKFP